MGYLSRKKMKYFKKYLDWAISASVIALIFFMGIKSGEVHIGAAYLLLTSLFFAFLVLVITYLLVFSFRRWLL
ncbi:MAG: hypothetical protein J7L63_00155 [Thermoplasmata archaeon]|nr:hypothetical protein [Thermoplasmata archaeon]